MLNRPGVAMAVDVTRASRVAESNAMQQAISRRRSRILEKRPISIMFRRVSRVSPALSERRLPELPVEAVGGADERQVRERLGEVAERLAGQADLLRVKAQVVGVGQHLLEDEPGLVQPSGAG